VQSFYNTQGSIATTASTQHASRTTNPFRNFIAHPHASCQYVALGLWYTSANPELSSFGPPVSAIRKITGDVQQLYGFTSPSNLYRLVSPFTVLVYATRTLCTRTDVERLVTTRCIFSVSLVSAASPYCIIRVFESFVVVVILLHFLSMLSGTPRATHGPLLWLRT